MSSFQNRGTPIVPTGDTNPEEAMAIAEEAYIFAYPMLEIYKTMVRRTGSREPASARGSFNRLIHSERLKGPEMRNIVAPNNDTLYSSAWLDLAAEPQVLSVPDIPSNRYFVFQLVNMYNHNFGYIGARTTGHSAADFLITGHRWTGEAPPGIAKIFSSESRFVFMLGRTLVDGAQDLANVQAIQRGYRLQSLSQYLGAPPPSPEPKRELIPYEPEKAATAMFISYFNDILGEAAIHPDDRPMIERFGKIGIGPARIFSPDDFSPAFIEAINQGVGRALNRIKAKVKDIGRRVNGWSTLVDIHGPREVMAGRPLVNAAGAMAALFGNDKEEASNFTAMVDKDGNDLNGATSAYRIRFEKGGFPPAKAFWSITLYSSPDIFMVENPIKRYSIGDRTRGIRFGEDGSLEIYLQHESPGKNRESNWLPAPRGSFILALRNYLPDQRLISSYTPPAIQRINH